MDFEYWEAVCLIWFSTLRLKTSKKRSDVRNIGHYHLELMTWYWKVLLKLVQFALHYKEVWLVIFQPIKIWLNCTVFELKIIGLFKSEAFDVSLYWSVTRHGNTLRLPSFWIIFLFGVWLTLLGLLSDMFISQKSEWKWNTSTVISVTFDY